MWFLLDSWYTDHPVHRSFDLGGSFDTFRSQVPLLLGIHTFHQNWNLYHLYMECTHLRSHHSIDLQDTQYTSKNLHLRRIRRHMEYMTYRL